MVPNAWLPVAAALFCALSEGVRAANTASRPVGLGYETFPGNGGGSILPVFYSTADGSVTQGSLTFGGGNNALLAQSSQNLTYLVQGLSSNIVSPSVTQARNAALSIVTNGSASIGLQIYNLYGEYFGSFSSQVPYGDQRYLVDGVTINSSSSVASLQLQPQLNNTLVILSNSQEDATAAISATYRGSETAGGSPSANPSQNPVVLLSQNSNSFSVELTRIFFTNASCAKISAHHEIGTPASYNSQDDPAFRFADANVTLYKIGTRGAIGADLNESAVSTLRLRATAEQNSSSTMTLPLEPGSIYMLYGRSAKYRESLSIYSTLIARVAMLSPSGGDCNAIPDTHLAVYTQFTGLPPEPAQVIAPVPPPTPAPTPAPGQEVAVVVASLGAPSNTLSGAALAGIIVGAIFGAGLLLLGLVGLLLWHRRRSKQRGSHEKIMSPFEVDSEDICSWKINLNHSSNNHSTIKTGLKSSGTDSTGLMDAQSLNSEGAVSLPSPAGKAAEQEGVVSVALHCSHAEPNGSGEDARPLQTLWKMQPDDLAIRCKGDGSPVSLGSGGFGSVYWGVYNRQDVAVKVITSHTPKQHERFLREIATLRACTHPHIVQFIGACVQEERTFMAMEYMPNGDLYTNLSADLNSFGWYDRGRQIALDVASGLAYLHSKGIAHLDLKSPNILLSESLRAKIGDVGLGKMLSPKNEAVTHGGTALWASPEQLLGEQVGTASDMWSFGTLLWEICSREGITGRMLRPLLTPKEAPQAVVDLIGRCHSRDPALRPTATEAYDNLLASPGR